MSALELTSGLSDVPDYTVRTIPFDLKKALRANGPLDLNWSDDKGLSFLTLGYSFALENAEYIVSSLARAADECIDDCNIRQGNKLFCQQELLHAKYHRYLNEILNPRPTTREEFHPRVYDFLYASYKIHREPELRQVFGASGYDEKMQALKEALLHIGRFETQTCVIGMTFFDTYFSNGRFQETLSSSINLPILYLYGYHLLEEIEHCSNAFYLYENVFGEDIWNEANLMEFVSAPEQPIHTDSYAVAFLLAKEAGIELTIQELRQNEFSQRHMEEFKRLIRVGFHPDHAEVLERRRAYIDMWDTEWEPALRSVIVESLLS